MTQKKVPSTAWPFENGMNKEGDRQVASCEVITIPERLLAQVDTFAKKKGETRSGLFLTATLEYMSRHQHENVAG